MSTKRADALQIGDRIAITLKQGHTVMTTVTASSREYGNPFVIVYLLTEESYRIDREFYGEEVITVY